MKIMSGVRGMFKKLTPNECGALAVGGTAVVGGFAMLEVAEAIGGPVSQAMTMATAGHAPVVVQVATGVGTLATMGKVLMVGGGITVLYCFTQGFIRGWKEDMAKK